MADQAEVLSAPTEFDSLIEMANLLDEQAKTLRTKKG